MILNNLFKRRKHAHMSHIIEYSNIIQFDDMGKPLILCIIKCDRGKTDQFWIDIDERYLEGKNIIYPKDNDLFVCNWIKDLDTKKQEEQWYCKEYKDKKDVDCKSCHTKYNMKHNYCCLDECGEHEFCKDCKGGIYYNKNK